MSILPIVKYPDKILETTCDRVTHFDHELKNLLDNMYKTMIAADGVGLAAPQIGVSRQIAVVDTGGEEGIIELINPELVTGSGEQIDVEGCLSFPGLYGKVPRLERVVVKANDRYGEEYTIEAFDYLARAIQHEMDHLKGILFTTKVIEYIDENDLEGMEEQ